MLNTACVQSVFPTSLSFDLQCYMESEHVTLTCEPAQGRWWLHGEHHGVGVPPGETWGRMTEIWTTPAATHRQMTGLQLWVGDREHVRPHFVSGIYSGIMFNWLVFINLSLKLQKSNEGTEIDEIWLDSPFINHCRGLNILILWSNSHKSDISQNDLWNSS